MKPNYSRVICFLLFCVMIFNVSACSYEVKASDLTDGITPGTVNGKAPDDASVSAAADFSIELFKKTMDDGGNSLISPLSVYIALAMTANGAQGETLTQMQAVLGMPVSELNEYLYDLANNIPDNEKVKLDTANSIWVRDGFPVLQDFLQKNADYYSADAYQAQFNNQTVSDINNWVKKNTDGTIDEIVKEIDPDTVMFLINTVLFDAEWSRIYEKEDVRGGVFTDFSGQAQNVDFMNSTEGLFLDDGRAVGFIKPYAGSKYSFAALLPNEGISIYDYAASLSGEGFLQTINNAELTSVYAGLPKFKSKYTKNLNVALEEMGMPSAFDGGVADFSSISKEPLFISEVLHKTYIQVDERGTKAGAVTSVAMDNNSIARSDPKTVRLDRPFVYAVIDNDTSLPLFIGITVRV